MKPEKPAANFDLIARPYRWLEYLTFGPALARCRNHFLPQLTDRRAALVLGDGDGRFLARLLAPTPASTPTPSTSAPPCSVSSPSAPTPRIPPRQPDSTPTSALP